MKNSFAITSILDASERAPLVLRGEPFETIKSAAELGYKGIEIHVVDAKTFPTEKTKAACKKYDVEISAVVSGQIYTRRKLSITSQDPNNRNAAMEEMRDYIDIAAELKTVSGIVIGWVKGNCGENKMEYYDLLAQQLKELAEYGAKKGQKILIEVINRYETNVFNTAESVKAFIETYKLSNVFIHLDTFHMNIEEKSLEDAIRLSGNLLGYIHFADSNREYIGSGHINFDKVMKALSDIGYGGYISLECIPAPDCKTAANLSLKHLKSYFLEK